ncbi:hypothetical protein NQ318_012668 [Aromia moschata]|uniref:Uncharacterized protein n=1 Tax=Aromia moschata TaxID=1265417 RepID=A0AAV8YGM7_9CUCU|nr:hypothetical protein NQ318_012668 [Aromia moschata]
MPHILDQLSFLRIAKGIACGGQTALHKAVAYKWREICCMLVAGGASLDVTDHRGLTPRLLALQREDRELASYLESQEHFQLVAADLGTDV